MDHNAIYRSKEVDMKQKITISFVIATFFAICAVTGCADVGTESKTDIDAEAASVTSSVSSDGLGSATEVDSEVAYGEAASNDAAEPEGKEADMETWKTAIDGLTDDFIFGMDVSSLLVEEKSGVKFYDFDGNEQDALKTFADSGINYIRIRVWNDPYDENGNGYGGGNNDLPAAIELGKRATKYGMRVLIDFHYSDFWADPQKQYAPKAWAGMSLSEKSAALYDYTKDSLTKLLDSGVDVRMVQIGNEINNGMSGETKIENVIELLKSGSKAVREISSERGKDIGIVVHYTDIFPKERVLSLIEKLVNGGLDFDMMGLSYYPFWHGDMDNMKNVIKYIGEHFGKKTFIAETSYCYTLEDGDGYANRVSKSDLLEGYPATVDGQASYMHDLYQNVNSAGGIGVFYWEGAWLPVGPANADNSPIWEKYGSGWASSYASGYDKDAAEYYGGCSWDNQAFFDFSGHPLESMKVFKYMK